MYAASQLPQERQALRVGTFLMGAAVTAWSAWVWNKANTEIKGGPRGS